MCERVFACARVRESHARTVQDIQCDTQTHKLSVFLAQVAELQNRLEECKLQNIQVLSLSNTISLSLSLSLSHTHTHTHTQVAKTASVSNGQSSSLAFGERPSLE